MAYEKPILWHRHAPSKPEWGAPCNGCGLCCLAEPCPLGMWVSRRRTGRCRALRWSGEQQRYVCGLLAAVQSPESVHMAQLPTSRWQQWRRAWWAWWVRRWIAAGVGCDAHMQALPVRQRLPQDVRAAREQ